LLVMEYDEADAHTTPSAVGADDAEGR